jgi:Ca2+-binding EF-hand superfamily protein
VFDGDGDGKLSDTDLYQAFKMFIGHQQADQQIKGLINAVLYKNGERQAHLPVTEFIKLIPPTELREKLTVELPTS